MNHHRPALLAIVLAGLLLAISPVAVARQDATADRFAAILNRAARARLQRDPLTPAEINAALLLVQEATTLRPDDANQWRLLLKVATLAENSDRALDATRTILKLDPADEATRLLRVVDAIDRYQTVEQRIAGYQTLLAPEQRDRLGVAVASRLALDLALLYQRAGDIDSFSHWLGEAAVIDPANRQAAAIAAGFFGANRDDDYGRAELLANLLVADPTDLSTQITLAQLLMGDGAYDGAYRLYGLLRDGFDAESLPIDNDMLADIATATWAIGDAPSALLMIEQRRHELLQSERTQPDSGSSSISTVLFTVAAAIRNRLGDDQAGAALLEVQDAYKVRITDVAMQPDSAAAQAQLQLELAWINIWLGRDADAAEAAIAKATELQPLTDEARARFTGLETWCRGQPEQAIEQLQPLAADDPAARLGLALAQKDLNRQREAAESFLAVARARPGTLMGVWAADHLAELLGRRMPLSELATRLNTLVGSLPRGLERYANQPTTALVFRIRPVERTVGPFEPVRFTITLSNQTVLPLAIDPQGPLHPQVVLMPNLSFARRQADQSVAPFVVDIDRILRLDPGASLSFEIDLNNSAAGGVIDQAPLSGAGITLTGMINFHARADGSLEPGLLGSVSMAPITRVDGVRVTDDWLRQTIDLVQAASTPDPRDLALLSHAATAPPTTEAGPDHDALVEEARAAVLSDFARLDPLGQAWMLSVMPANAAFEPLLNSARKSDDRHVKLAYLLFHCSGADDPMLDAATRGDDETIRAIAEAIRAEFAPAPANDADADHPADDGGGGS